MHEVRGEGQVLQYRIHHTWFDRKKEYTVPFSESKMVLYVVRALTVPKSPKWYVLRVLSKPVSPKWHDVRVLPMYSLYI